MMIDVGFDVNDTDGDPHNERTCPELAIREPIYLTL